VLLRLAILMLIICLFYQLDLFRVFLGLFVVAIKLQERNFWYFNQFFLLLCEWCKEISSFL